MEQERRGPGYQARTLGAHLGSRHRSPDDHHANHHADQPDHADHPDHPDHYSAAVNAIAVVDARGARSIG